MSLRQSLIIVEDSPDDEALSLKAISACGVPCDVRVLRLGGEALRVLIASEGPTPDLIVLDFHLPDYNGLEILRELRLIERLRLVPIVMLSSLDSSEQISECLREGASSWVQKPVDPQVYAEPVILILRYWLTADTRPNEPKLKSSAPGSYPLNHLPN